MENKFFSFKNEHFTVFDGRDSIILIEPTGNQKRNYYLPKGKPYILEIGGGQRTGERIAEERMYLNIEQQAFENARGNYRVTVALKSNSDFRWDISVTYDDIKFKEDDNDVEIKYSENRIHQLFLQCLSNAHNCFFARGQDCPKIAYPLHRDRQTKLFLLFFLLILSELRYSFQSFILGLMSFNSISKTLRKCTSLCPV